MKVVSGWAAFILIVKKREPSSELRWYILGEGGFYLIFGKVSESLILDIEYQLRGVSMKSKILKVFDDDTFWR